LLIFLLIGATALVAGAALLWMEWSEHREELALQEAREEAGWLEAEAVVLSCTATDRNARTGEWRYRWESEWTDLNGQTHRSSGSGYGGSASCSDHTVLYNPANPDEVMSRVGWFLPVPFALCVLGFGFTFIGVKEWLKWLKARGATTPPASPYR
jgi:hypothetical protein